MSICYAVASFVARATLKTKDYGSVGQACENTESESMSLSMIEKKINIKF